MPGDCNRAKVIYLGAWCLSLYGSIPYTAIFPVFLMQIERNVTVRYLDKRLVGINLLGDVWKRLISCGVVGARAVVVALPSYEMLLWLQ